MTSHPLDPLLRPDFSPLFSFDAQISEKHESNRFHVLQVGDDFWLRLEGHPDWLGVFDNVGGQLSAIARSGDRQHFEFSLHRALNARNWGRVISLPDTDGKLWRVAWRERRSFLMRPDTREAVTFSSKDDWMRGAWIKDSAHFAARLKREWKNPASDISTARDYLGANDEERRLFGVQWKRGSWEELRTVARWAVQIEHPGDERQLIFSCEVNAPFEERHEDSRWRRLHGRLLKRNVPVFDPAIPRRHFALRPFSFQQEPLYPALLLAEVEAPSEHERLEARLELHAWLRQNAPDLLEEWN